jgi:DNA-binding GntR family transcriptional regulator
VAEFAVSAITVRRAVRELMVEGWLFGQQGLGVFVADRRRVVRVLSGELTRSFGDEIRRAGMTPRISEVSFAQVVPDPELRAKLALPRRTRVFRHEKLIFADELPIALDVVHLPKKIAGLIRPKLGDEFVFTLLNELKLGAGRIRFRFESAAAPEREAALLRVSFGSPLIIARYIIVGARNRPILEGYTSARADRMSFELSATPPEARLREFKVG